MAVLLPAFFLSGAVSLVYQVLWTRQLGLVFGVTIQAASTVLACFMGGLALGSYLAGRRLNRTARPLRAFALVELGIGICGVIVPWLLGLADGLVVMAAPHVEQTPALGTALRLVLTAVVLTGPATLMGMTYPLLLGAVGRSPDGVRRHASLLYAVNTSGAILGVLASSLWLIPTVGLAATGWTAVAGNLVIAALTAWASRRTAPDATPAATDTGDSHSATPDTPALSRRARIAVLVVLGLSGTVTLALEIVWFRVLVFFLRPTTYAFACMLLAVLAGLALGSYLVTPWMRRRANWLAVLGVTELLIGLSGLLSAFALVRSQAVLTTLFEMAGGLSHPWDVVLPFLTASAAAILPTAILLGAAFPIGLVLWTTGGGDPGASGRRVGELYALNVAGAIVGSLGAGFLLLPAFGAQTSLVAVCVIPIVGGCVLLLLATTRRRAVLASVAAVTAFGWAAFSLPDVFRHALAGRYPGYDVVWYEEAAQATVTVAEQNGRRTLIIDGEHHASTAGSMVGYHRTFGTLGIAVHPDPRQVLVVGLGGGATAGAASILPNTRTTVVELLPPVVRAARWFEVANRGLLDNPNVDFRIADGRYFLKTTRERFDVITADLLLPYQAGAASLYSADYYALAKAALKPGGIMVQWIPPDTEFQYRLMLRSFLSVFPHVTFWLDGGIVIGSDTPLRLDPGAFAVKLAYPSSQAALVEAGFESFEALTARYLTDRSRVEAYVGAGPMLTDDVPLTEYFLSMPVGSPPVDLRPYAGDVAEIIARRPTPSPGTR